MKSNLYIKYKNTDETSGFDLISLGESFIGIDANLREFFKISEIDGELIIKTEKISKGSVEIKLVNDILTTLPFHNVKDFLDFLYFVGAAEYQIATTFFNSFGNAYKTATDFYKENPLIPNPLEAYFGYYLTKMLGTGSTQKDKPTTHDESKNIPTRYANKLHQMIKNGKFKRTLKPIVEGTVNEILVSDNPTFQRASKIDEENFENYLPEEEKILPELENGSIHNFMGELLAIQSTKGEILKFKIHDIDPQNDLLTARPEEGKNTEDYMKYYKKFVNFKVQILRKSLYKKPELLILQIENSQTEIFGSEDNGITPTYLPTKENI